MCGLPIIIIITRNVGTPKGRPTWWPPPPSRWWFRRVGENSNPFFLALVDRSSWNFGTMSGTLRNFQRRFSIFYIMLLAGDIGPPSKLPLSCEVVENRLQFMDPNFFAGWRTQNFLWQLPWFTPYRVAKFGWALGSEVGVHSAAMKKNA